MARKPAFTRESALEYLRSRPDVQRQGRKPLEDLKTPELLRKARAAQKADLEGRAYSNKEARGHAGNVHARKARISELGKRQPDQGTRNRLPYAAQFKVGNGTWKLKPGFDSKKQGSPTIADIVISGTLPATEDITRLVAKVDAWDKQHGRIKRDLFTFRVYGWGKISDMEGEHDLPTKVNRARIQQVVEESEGDITKFVNALFDYEPTHEKPMWMAIFSIAIIL